MNYCLARHEIHVALEYINAKATTLARAIKKKFEKVGL